MRKGIVLPDTTELLRQIAARPLAARSQQSLWQQIAERIAAACEDATLMGNARLPGENRMAEIFGVTRVTMRHALARLQQEGLLHARKGVGIFVRPKPLRYRVDHGSHFADGLDLPQSTVSVASSGIAAGQARADEAEALALPGGAPVIRLTRLRQIDGAPVYLAAKTFPAALLPQFEASYAARASVRDVFEAHGISSYRRAETRVTGGFASVEEAAALRLTPGSPVLRTVAVNTDANGNPIEYNLGTWPLTAVELVLRDPVARPATLG